MVSYPFELPTKVHLKIKGYIRHNLKAHRKKKGHFLIRGTCLNNNVCGGFISVSLHKAFPLGYHIDLLTPAKVLHVTILTKKAAG